MAGRLTLGRTDADADGGADIADRLTEWRSIATDALRAKGPSINDVHILEERDWLNSRLSRGGCRDYNVGPPYMGSRGCGRCI